ncbi:hypothetical protein A2303_03300 [Candidatus Falkowbacteria bacterium RIFOXYB2_FULL_47_14]|nr:MAG: hypothetical protein A2468_01335 [Candidatus Falkowbacteria bacterium RIFOXYC2_FULL_46_15]OGF44035.1 MAG: hypothetical protein A2303_03300 [Candidatus Falkowbacteria bacterium RIFOXYB2_FULL_47_14]
MEKPKSHSENMLPNQELNTNPEKERQEKVSSLFDLVRKINESGESLPFPGIDPEAYLKMKKTDDEYPGYTTPTDEIIGRCKEEGIKVVTGKHSESGNIFVLPAGSNDIEMDSIAPHQLSINAVENEHLRELIRLTTKKEI